VNIDRQRISAVIVLEDLGYTFSEGRWQAPPSSAVLTAEADALFGMLADQAGELMGCVEGSAEDAQLQRIRGVLEAYESKRWPGGRAESAHG
jgi:hypothetical protein